MLTMASACHAPIIAELARKLWPEHTLEELQEEYTLLLKRNDAAVFFSQWNGNVHGFAQCQLRRDYVEGTESSPVGYLEGIYVEEAYRGSGIAKYLLAACEDWARNKGCKEFASDCELDNRESLEFHLRTGFREANRIVCFTKQL